jgi:starvation-inducible DNA-binding protein
MSDNTLIEQLAKCLANSTIMYHRTHGFHWNITGRDFPQWHEKFEEIYEDVYSSLDPFAENIRKLGGIPVFRLAELSADATVQDAPVRAYDPQTLVSDLLKTNTDLLACLNRTFDAATSAKQQGIANFVAGRIDMHQKWQWQLSTSL